MRLETGYREGEHKIVDQEEEPLLFPGGLPPESAHTITLGSGAYVNVGDIFLRKVPRYRAHIRVERGDCPQIESVRLYLLRAGRELPPPQVVPCESDALLKGLEPGSYTLYAVSDWQAGRDTVEKAVWATTPFEIKDEGVEVTIVPRRGVVIEGTFRMADEKSELPPYSFAAYADAPVEGAAPIFEEFFDSIAPNQFRMASRGVASTLRVPPSANAYVQEMRYNGVPVRGMRIPISPGDLTHRLEVVLDTNFAGIRVTVSDPKAMTSYPVLYLQRPGAQNFDVAGVIAGGALDLDRLAPGEYRFSAAENGASLDTVARNAKSITLRSGAMETLTLQIRQ